MSITLFCLFKGNSTASAFSVKISRNEPVSELKEAIKAKKAPEFDDYSADKFKLWKVKLSSDHDDLLRNISLKDDEELSAINDIGDYWPEKPPKKNVHVIVEPPKWATSFAESYKQYVHDFDVVVIPKQKAYKWTASTQFATLEIFKDSIRGMYHPPALEYDGTVLNFIDGEGRYSPRDDLSFRNMLHSLVLKKNFKLTVIIELLKPFNEWTFPKVCELYGLSDDLNPSIDVYPNFSCGCADLKDEKSQSVVKHLMAELETTPLDVTHEATKSIYSYCYLACGVSFYEKNFKIIPGKNITGHNGQGNLDYAIECRSTNRIVGLVEVKKDNFKQGFAQTTVQMESSLTCRKRKLNEIEDSSGLDKVWGIVTDAEKWYFMEYRLDSEGKPTFKLSEPVIVLYKEENLQARVEKVLGHIVWLLEETQKSLDDSRSGEQSRIIKKHKS